MLKVELEKSHISLQDVSASAQLLKSKHTKADFTRWMNTLKWFCTLSEEEQTSLAKNLKIYPLKPLKIKPQ
jgi:hypothetical protein